MTQRYIILQSRAEFLKALFWVGQTKTWFMVRDMELTWYMQEEGKPEVIDEGSITLDEALILLFELDISPSGGEIPIMVDFRDREKAFLEFTRLSWNIYQVRYYDPQLDEDIIQEQPLHKALLCLIDFFNGNKVGVT